MYLTENFQNVIGAKQTALHCLTALTDEPIGPFILDSQDKARADSGEPWRGKGGKHVECDVEDCRRKTNTISEGE